MPAPKKKENPDSKAPAANPEFLEKIWAILKPGSKATPTEDGVLDAAKTLMENNKKAIEAGKKAGEMVKEAEKKAREKQRAEDEKEIEKIKAEYEKKIKELGESAKATVGGTVTGAPVSAAINPAFLTESDKEQMGKAAEAVRGARKTYGDIASKQADIDVLLGLPPIMP